MKKNELIALADSGLAPYVPYGPNVFTTPEFAAASDITYSWAGTRLRELAKQGKIKRIRTKHEGKIKLALQYVGK